MIFGSLFDTFQRVLFLTRDAQENTADIKELRQEVQSLSDEVKRLAFDIERIRETSRHERETLILQLNKHAFAVRAPLAGAEQVIPPIFAETVRFPGRRPAATPHHL